MADANNINLPQGLRTEGDTTNGMALIISLPTVSIPQNYQRNKSGSLIFQVETAEGSIQIEAWRFGFSCKGTAAALAAYGLLQTDWLPGIPGNNLTRQSVAFEEGVPRLLKSRGGARYTVPHIVITRLSRCKYGVRVPTTKEQQEFIQSLDERHKHKTREEKPPSYSPQSPGEVRHDCLRLIDTAMSINDTRMTDAGFHYNKESMTRINRAFDELRSALAEGGIVQGKPDLQRDGNVIYLNAQPAKLPIPA
jgi:hypothetical protein